LIEELYQDIGRRPVELEWLKKNLALPLESKRRLVESEHSEISIVRQCELLGLNRSSYYYEAAGESSYNEYLMRKLDEQYTQTPFYGVLRMTEVLRSQGEAVNPKRVRRLLRKMGLEARVHPSFAALTLNPFPPLGEGLGIRFPFSLKHGLSTFDDQRLTLKGWS
jgi:putative transposase